MANDVVVGSAGHFEFLWVAIGQMAYVYYFLLRLRKGLPRLLALLPLLPFSFLVPWRGPTAPERTALSFLFLWMMMSKLLMVVWDAGPGSDPSVLSSFPRFFCAMTFSLHVRRDSSASVRLEDDNAADKSTGEGYTRSGFESQIGLVRRKFGVDSKASRKLSGEKSHDVVGKPSHGNGFSVASSWIETAATSLSWQMALLRSIFYFVLSVSWLRLVLQWKPFMSEYVTYMTYVVLIYVMCLFLFEGCAALPASILGTELHQQFNMPFLATSLADFWGRRWNLLVNNLLRVSVYEPMLRFLSGGNKKPSSRDRAVSTLAAFLVSGLEHELIFFYLNKTMPSWEMTTFFVLSGVGTVVEGLVKPRQRLGMPTVLMRAYTLSFLFFTSAWFFFPPVIKTGMADQCLLDLQTFSFWIQTSLLPPGNAR